MAHEFMLIGFTLIAGFIAHVIFERTKISHVILLMALGFLLGPVFNIIDVSEGSTIIGMLEFVSALALILLLFDGGIEFDLFKLAKSIPKSTLFTFLVFALTLFFVAVLAMSFLGWSFLEGLLLGAVVGGSSGAVVLSILEKTKVKSETKSLLTVESTLTDALVILTAVIIMQVLSAQFDPEVGKVAGLFLSSFTIAIALGLVASAIWVFLMNRFELDNYNYMMMLALLFVLYAVTESTGGNGGIAVFTFGVALGNAKKLSRFVKTDWTNPLSRSAKSFQEEVSFFVRTFFFVYVGMFFSPEYFTQEVVVFSLAILFLIVFARKTIQKLLFDSIPNMDKNIIVSMVPRGLAAAVVASLPATQGLVLDNFKEYVFMIILLSNVLVTIGVFLFKAPESEVPKEKKPVKKKVSL